MQRQEYRSFGQPGGTAFFLHFTFTMRSSQRLGLVLVLLTLLPSFNFEHQRGHLPGNLEAEVVAFWDQRGWKSLAIVLSDASSLLLNLSRKLRRNGGSRLIRTMLADAVSLVPRNNDYLQVVATTVCFNQVAQCGKCDL